MQPMNRLNHRTNSVVTFFDLLFRTSPFLLVFFMILTPNVKIPGLPAIRLEQMLILVVLVMELGCYGLRRLKILFSRKMLFLFTTLVLFMMVTIGNGYLKGYDVIYNDFFELIKIAVYCGAFVLIRLHIRSEDEKKKLLNAILVLLLISSFIAITQYFNFFNINELYVRHLAPTQFKTLVEGYKSPRVIGITSNPNFFALFAGIGGFIAFRNFLTEKSFKFLLLTIYFFIILNMTKSRTGFLFFVIGILVLFIMEAYRRVKRTYREEGKAKGRRKILTFLFLLLVLTGLFSAFVMWGPESLTWRLRHGLDLKNDGSFMTRVNRWREYAQYYDLPHLLGIGPTKSNQLPFQVDNEWLIFLKELGLSGTMLLVVIFMFPLRIKTTKPYGDLYLAVILAGSVFMMTSVFVNIHQVMPLVMVLAALSMPVSITMEEHSDEDIVHY